MAVRSARIVGPVVVTSAPSVLYTVAVGMTTLLKWISVVATSVGPTNVAVAINGNLFPNVIHYEAGMGTNEVRQTPLFIVLVPGDTLRVFTNVGQVATATISGAELAGVA